VAILVSTYLSTCNNEESANEGKENFAYFSAFHANSVANV